MMKIYKLALLIVVFCYNHSAGQTAGNEALNVIRNNSLSGQNSIDTAKKNFDGLYFGAAAGTQNLFGGSFVGGIDVLAQESRFVAELSAGYRKQLFRDKFLLGIEFQFGFTDGNLMHRDPEQQLEIAYKNNTQSGLGGTIGAALGKRKNILLFGYVNETTRKFDVSIKEQGQRYQQKDEQGMLKYGVGAEVNVYSGLNARISFGRLRVDFGDQVTNINVEDKWDAMFGLTYQF